MTKSKEKKSSSRKGRGYIDMNQSMSVLNSASIRCKWTIQCQAKMQSIQSMAGIPLGKGVGYKADFANLTCEMDMMA